MEVSQETEPNQAPAKSAKELRKERLLKNREERMNQIFGSQRKGTGQVYDQATSAQAADTTTTSVPQPQPPQPPQPTTGAQPTQHSAPPSKPTKSPVQSSQKSAMGTRSVSMAPSAADSDALFESAGYDMKTRRKEHKDQHLLRFTKQYQQWGLLVRLYHILALSITYIEFPIYVYAAVAGINTALKHRGMSTKELGGARPFDQQLKEFTQLAQIIISVTGGVMGMLLVDTGTVYSRLSRLHYVLLELPGGFLTRMLARAPGWRLLMLNLWSAYKLVSFAFCAVLIHVLAEACASLSLAQDKWFPSVVAAAQDPAGTCADIFDQTHRTLCDWQSR